MCFAFKQLFRPLTEPSVLPNLITSIMKHLLLPIPFLFIQLICYSQAITDDGTNVGIGNATPAHRLDVAGDINLSTGSILKINSRPVVSTIGTANTFIGDFSGTLITTGYNNAFIGY